MKRPMVGAAVPCRPHGFGRGERGDVESGAGLTGKGQYGKLVDVSVGLHCFDKKGVGL